ncbi:MAG: hypothetical protein AB7T06_37980 [Kofleriaceae bacterium]
MDYDVIYTDDERNADRRRPARRPGSRTVFVPQGARPTVITGGGSYRPHSAQQQNPYYPPQGGVASRFGMTTGELIDTGIQLLAAITPLPAAPVLQGETSVDIDNLMTYQGALWQHAKRDEQLRTLGGLLVRILK